LINIVMIVLRG